ncbi:MAG: hypothetical protein ABIP35_06820, partial [Ginsengibacter sp.]
MKKHLLLLILFLLTVASTLFAQSLNSTLTLPLLPNEQWWGGAAQYGYKMPFNKSSNFSFNLYGDVSNNQSASLLLSNKGRWVWCNDPFQFSFQNNELRITNSTGEKTETGVAGSN